VTIGVRAREAGGLQPPPPNSGKTVVFRAEAISQNGKCFFVFIKRKNGIHSVERDKVPEIQDFY